MCTFLAQSAKKRDETENEEKEREEGKPFCFAQKIKIRLWTGNWHERQVPLFVWMRAFFSCALFLLEAIKNEQ